MAVLEKVREARAGEDIQFWGEPRTVAESCDNMGGSWYCDTHEEGFRGNWMVTSHSDDGKKHLLVWICADHGPEDSGIPS